MKKNLILGAIKGYKFYLIKPFFETLKKIGFNGEVVIFYEDISYNTIKKIKDYGVELISIDGRFKKKRGLDQYFDSRFLVYQDFLEKNASKYNFIFLTDIRDVIFQKDIFHEKLGNLNFFLEDKKISENPYNSMWVLEISNERFLKDHGSDVISCVGTSIGKSKDMLLYLSKLAEMFELGKSQSVQGIHNFLIYSGAFPNAKIFKNFELIATLGGHTNKINLDNQKNVLDEDGKIVPIVHQYDRIKSLSRKYYSKRILIYNFRIKIKKKIKNLLLKLRLDALIKFYKSKRYGLASSS